jgi:hypothetical protein
MMRFGVADQPKRPNLLLRSFPALKGSLLAIFWQVGWRLVASNLPSKLRTLWRVIAREMTTPSFHHRPPRKARSPRPF